MRRTDTLDRVMFLVVLLVGALVLCSPTVAHAADSQSMWRLYNPYTGEHLYTASANERNTLAEIGWEAEGVGWIAPTSSNTPVYRLYNPYVPGGDHHYTTSVEECMALVNEGWRDEGICWYSADSQSVAVMRQYNPFATTGTHNYTTDSNEASSLVGLGWNDEGVGWYALSRGDVTTTTSSGITVSGPSGFTDTAAFKRVEQQVASVRNSGHDLGLVVIDLHSGRSIQYNTDRRFYSASTVKALYCAMLYERYGSVGGMTSYVENALVNSSNEAYSTLVHTYGRSPFYDWLRANGATGAYAPADSLNYVFISAGDMGRIWRHIWRYSLTGSSGAKQLGGYLKRTHHSAMGGLLRKRYETWCKPGWYPTDGNFTSTNDTGIVFSDCGPYVMIVMTNYSANFSPLFSIIDALNAAHGALCGGSTESLMGGGVSLS